jgi:cell division protein ZapB
MDSHGNLPHDNFAQVRMLGERIDKLADLVRRLAEENRSLRAGQEQLANERAQLLNKNELARSRVEAMIHRLKSLEGSP